MTIQWYPGHMKRARQEIAKAIPSNDVVLEVLDARMPIASSNPVLKELRDDKPCIKILTKSDLADPAVTRAWIRQLGVEEPNCAVLEISLTKTQPAETRIRVTELCKRLAPHRNTRAKTVRAIVVGIPNVGKSTLINSLMERAATRVGDQPGITKVRQLVTLKDGMTLSDNAGVLWPRIDEASIMRLALGGAIPETEMDYESVGLFAAELLLRRYPKLVCSRFKLEAPPASADELLEIIGRRHAGLRSGGRVDLHKAAGVLIHEFRSGKLGRISLEAPGDTPAPPPEPSNDEPRG